MTRSMKENSRTFRVVSSSFGLEGGRYVSEGPMEAARKAARILFTKAEKQRKSSVTNHRVVLELKEITRVKKIESSRDRFYYDVRRITIPVAERKVLRFPSKTGGPTMTFTPMYDYEVKSVTKDDFQADHRGGSGSGSGSDSAAFFDGYNQAGF
jgi:hypothetical protein